jgi:putative peptidoglycan lipid II flippase
MALIKSAATVGGYTLVSRLLGFVRDMLLASIVGSGPVAEAFVIAFRFPNLFRRLFGEGAFNSAFVPLFAKQHEGEGAEAARRFAQEVYSVLLVTVLGLVALCEVLMPLLMYLFAPGFASDPAKFDLAIVMTRITFPYLLFMSLVALLGGVLNSLHRFAAAAAAPIVLNVVMIGVLASIMALDWGASAATGEALAWGVSLAGLLQFAMLWIVCRRAGMRLKLTRPRITPQVRRMVRLGVPGTIAGGITQLNLVISTVIASLHAGAASWLYYADRVYQLPLGIVGVAIGTVLLPELSRRLRTGDSAGVEASQNRALELSLLLTVPAAIGLMALSGPVVNVLFERGAFTPADTSATAGALAAFATGLPAFVMIKVFAPGFFAREDTRTPMIFAVIGVGLNIAGALALFPFLAHVGIALATSLSAWVNAGLLGVTLQRRGGFTADDRLKRNLVWIILASLVMGAALVMAMISAADLFVPVVGLAMRIATLAGLVAAGMVLYFGLAWATGAFRPADFGRAFRRSA